MGGRHEQLARPVDLLFEGFDPLKIHAFNARQMVMPGQDFKSAAGARGAFGRKMAP
jgi:hypothetical protein